MICMMPYQVQIWSNLGKQVEKAYFLFIDGETDSERLSDLPTRLARIWGGGGRIVTPGLSSHVLPTGTSYCQGLWGI